MIESSCIQPLKHDLDISSNAISSSLSTLFTSIEIEDDLLERRAKPSDTSIELRSKLLL